MPVAAWLEGRVRQRITIELPAAIQRIEIDVERRLPDIDRADNVWVR
jgi:hypothetical protein